MRTSGTISNELIRVTNLALLCEDIINGLIAARQFHGPDDPTEAVSQIHQGSPMALAIILDIEQRDWYYNIQAGVFDFHFDDC